ncbi:hypothetical protein PR202_gb09461 [Eleusine coracana subsp. coracana]|uniref:Secretory carrier-associated membrane protein n=1 Tax=Eleusine coracana subsp. coracana TaxID=191504 RepID=A0AAV5EH93_ELECO|nr:hypothetical protein PR202_gb09461 [Eleusine coracana subsp. coracana]
MTPPIVMMQDNLMDGEIDFCQGNVTAPLMHRPSYGGARHTQWQLKPNPTTRNGGTLEHSVSRGILAAIDTFSDHAIVGIFYFVGFALFTLETLVSIWVLGL